MGLRSLWRRYIGAEVGRSTSPLGFQDWVNYFTFLGNQYQYTTGGGGTLVGGTEKVGSGFAAYIKGAYGSNGVVFACELARLSVFSEARFQWREIRGGRPGNLFGNAELGVLEEPWPGGTTADLLMRMTLDGDFGGNAFIHRRGNRLWRLRPDWVTIIYGGDPWEIGTEVAGYGYQPGGPAGGNEPVILQPETVAHFAPLPDPLSPWKGMAWLTPVLREVDADVAATTHKQALFEKGATPNMVVKFDSTVTKELFDHYVKLITEGHEGPANAYKTLFLGAGADATVVGANLRQLDFKAVQGAGETRIAAAAGVPPIIVGLSEGLQAATYSNYGQARRRYADGTCRPWWRNVCGSLQRIVNLPRTNGRAELWYDDRDIAFLQEDRKDEAEVQVAQASAIKQLVDAGFEASAVVDAVTSGDLGRLEHTGLFSVQLQPPGTENPSTNGKAPAPVAAE